jgi:hypothetical protein
MFIIVNIAINNIDKATIIPYYDRSAMYKV